MKNIILTILGMIVLIPQISFAEQEIVWELEGVGLGVGDIILSNTQDLFYYPNYNDDYSSIQIRSIIDGRLIDSIVLDDFKKRTIDKISITDDDKFLAISGDFPQIIIWDLINKQIYKKFTKVIFEGDSAHFWKSASISPDGTKLTAIAVKEFSSIVTELVVFDIETEEVIISENRNNMDKINGVYYGPIWVSTEFSPNGEYLVTELSVNWDHQSGQVVLDSVYIYNNNFTIVGNLQNQFQKNDLSFSDSENMLSSKHGNKLIIYNLDTRETQDIFLERSPYSVLFSRVNSSEILLSLGTRAYTYNIKNKVEEYNYENNIYASVILNDNSKVIGHGVNGLLCLNTFWNLTSVDNSSSKTTFYPNPVNNLLRINLDITMGAEFEYDLFDINSNKLETKNLNFLKTGINYINIDFSLFPPQTYFLKIYNSNESHNFKIIKE